MGTVWEGPILQNIAFVSTRLLENSLYSVFLLILQGRVSRAFWCHPAPFFFHLLVEVGQGSALKLIPSQFSYRVGDCDDLPFTDRQLIVSRLSSEIIHNTSLYVEKNVTVRLPAYVEDFMKEVSAQIILNLQK